MSRKPSNQVPVAPAAGGRVDAPDESRGTPVPWRLAGAGAAVEALGLLVLAGFSAYGVISGAASTTTRALTEAAVLLVLAIGVALLARNLFARKSLAKTPTLLWNVLLLPVGSSLITGGAPLWGWITVVLAVGTIAAALFVPRYDLDDDTVV